MDKKQLPNCITAFRICGAALLMLTEPFSVAFYMLYSLCGLSDVIDGWLARKMDVSSELGARLDSVADLLFYSAMLIKLLPTLIIRLTPGIWWAICGVLILRCASYAVAGVKYRRFASLHTYMNKFTGLCVFLVPYFIFLPCYIPLCAAVCAAAGLASAEELLIHIFSSEYIPARKTLFQKGGKT